MEETEVAQEKAASVLSITLDQQVSFAGGEQYQFTADSAGIYFLQTEINESISADIYVLDSNGEEISGEGYLLMPGQNLRFDLGQGEGVRICIGNNQSGTLLVTGNTAGVITGLTINAEQEKVLDPNEAVDYFKQLEVTVNYGDNTSEIISDWSEANTWDSTEGEQIDYLTGQTADGQEVAVELRDETRRVTMPTSALISSNIAIGEYYVYAYMTDNETMQTEEYAVTIKNPVETAAVLSLTQTQVLSVAENGYAWYKIDANAGNYVIRTQNEESDDGYQASFSLYSVEEDNLQYITDHWMYENCTSNYTLENGKTYLLLVKGDYNDCTGNLILAEKREVMGVSIGGIDENASLSAIEAMNDFSRATVQISYSNGDTETINNWAKINCWDETTETSYYCYTADSSNGDEVYLKLYYEGNPIDIYNVDGISGGNYLLQASIIDGDEIVAQKGCAVTIETPVIENFEWGPLAAEYMPGEILEALGNMSVNIVYDGGDEETIDGKLALYDYDEQDFGKAYFGKTSSGSRINVGLVCNGKPLDMMLNSTYIPAGVFQLAAYIDDKDEPQYLSKEFEVKAAQEIQNLYGLNEPGSQQQLQTDSDEYIYFAFQADSAGWYNIEQTVNRYDAIDSMLYKNDVERMEVPLLTRIDTGYNNINNEYNYYIKLQEKEIVYLIIRASNDGVQGTVSFKKAKQIESISIAEGGKLTFDAIEVTQRLIELPIEITYDDGTKEICEKWDTYVVYTLAGQENYIYLYCVAEGGYEIYMRGFKDGKRIDLPCYVIADNIPLGNMQLRFYVNDETDPIQEMEMTVQWNERSAPAIEADNSKEFVVEPQQCMYYSFAAKENGTYTIECNADVDGYMSYFLYQKIDNNMKRIEMDYHSHSFTLNNVTAGSQYALQIMNNQAKEWGTAIAGDISVSGNTEHTEHTYETEYTVDVEPTCTEAGSKSIHCSVCGVKQEGSEVSIPALGHQPGAWVVTKAATCGTSGTQMRKCSVCGEIVEMAGIPATGKHSWSGWSVTAEPTALKQGTKIRNCTVCGKTETAAVAKLTPAIKLNTTSLTLKVIGVCETPKLV